MTPAIPAAPDRYDRGTWQQIVNAIRQALLGAFRAGQDLRLVRGERFSLKSAGGVETFFTVDDAGNLLTPTAGAEYVKTSSAASLTLTAPGFHVFTGTTATWTLPSLAGSPGWTIRVKNRGSGDLTIERAGSDQLYTSAAVDSLTLPAGASTWLTADGSFWDVERIRAPYG